MHKNVPDAAIEIPWTISYIIRKRAQIDSFSELPQEKRPPDKIIWDGTVEDMEDWFDRVFQRKGKKELPDEFVFDISEDDIE